MNKVYRFIVNRVALIQDYEWMNETGIDLPYIAVKKIVKLIIFYILETKSSV